MSEMDLRRFLEEDVGAGDLTTETFVPDVQGKATIICEEDAVVAGLEEATEIFRLLGVDCESLISDGDKVSTGSKVMMLSGPLKGILTGERTALNFLMKMSGIATTTASLVSMTKDIDPGLKIAGTRKTTPGFREFEKKAIVLGGGWPHRSGLYDMIMVKDNHIVACGGFDNMLERVKDVPPGIRIEIEVTSIEEGISAAEKGADIIMADHMSPSDTKELRSIVKRIDNNILIEASGNITAENILDYAGCADIISLGSLTHSSRAVHFSLDVER